MEWLLPVVAGGLLLVFIIGRSLSFRRMREMRAWATQRGLAFAAGMDSSIGIRFLELPLIGSGRAGARNRATGDWQGREIHAFDLVVGPDADAATQVTSRYTCVLVKAELPLIPLCIRPHLVDDRLPADMGPDLHLDSPTFADDFQAVSPDHRWASDLLHPEAVADLLARPRWRLELGGWYCLVAAPGQLDAGQLEAALAMAGAFLDAIPAANRREILGESPATDPSAD